MDEREIDITPFERNGYHFYTLYSQHDKESVTMTPAGLLQLASWVESERAKLTREAQVDDERDQAAWEAEASDMAKIEREWRDYRDEGLGERG